MTTSANSRCRFAWLALVLPLLLLVLVPICAALRIRTYATGQDPRIFISLAKGLVEHTKSLSDVSSVVIPGWPLALAGIIRVFGMYAAFWVNLPLFMATLLLLALLLADLLGSFSRGAFAALVCVLLLLGGHENNPHFLLWSFRQTPIYFFSLLSLFAVRRAGLSATVSRFRAFLWLCTSLVALALATAVRETSPLIFPSLVLFLCFSPLAPAGVSVPPGSRRFLLISFFSLCAAFALIGALVVILTGFSPVNAQSAFFLEWLSAMFSQSFAQLPLWGMLHILREEFAAPGLLFLAVGIALSFSRRYRPFLFLFGLPALSYLVFDGLLKIHVRFILSTLFFAAPIAALGAFALFRALVRLIRRIHHRGIPPPPAYPLAACLATVLLAIYAFAKVLPAVRPWGARISRADVETLLNVLSPYASPTRPVIVDPHHRLIQDVLASFSSWPLIEATPSVPSDAFLADPPLPYVQSFSMRAVHPTVVAPHATDILEGIADLTPVPNGTFSFGNVPYDLILLSPPSRASQDFVLPAPPPSLRTPAPTAVFLRLSIPASAAAHPLSAAVNGVPVASNLPPGRALVPVPSSLLSATNLVLTLAADAPFPSAVHPRWIHPDAPLFLDFGAKLIPSTDSFLSPEFVPLFDLPNPDPAYPSWPIALNAREFPGSASVKLPSPPPADTPSPVILYLELSAVRREMSASLDVELTLPDFPSLSPMTATIPHSDRPQSIRFVTPPLPSPPTTVHISVSSRDLPPAPLLESNPRHGNARLYSLSCALLFPVTSLSIDFSLPGDDALFGSGFFRQEAPNTSAGGRWCAPEASLLLPPLLDEGARVVSILAEVSAFPTAELPSVAFSIAGQSFPATSEPDPATPSRVRFSASLPPGLFSRVDANPLVISVSPPFRPSAYGSSDSRDLGLFLKSFSLELP